MTIHYLDLSYSINFKEYVECLDKGDLSDNAVPELEFSKIFDSFLSNTYKQIGLSE